MSIRQIVHALPLVVLCLANPVTACEIPVFRYALENWNPDPYVLVVAHRGDLNSVDARLLTELLETLNTHGQSLNIELKVVDLSKKNDPLLEAVLGERVASIQSPRMVLIYPFGHVAARIGSGPPDAAGGRKASSDRPTPTRTGLTPVPPGPSGYTPGPAEIPDDVPRLAWSGDLTSDHIRRLSESPVRKQIAKEILAGNSAVWVLLECGDEAKDDAAEATLRNELAELQKTLKISDQKAIESDEFYQPDTKVELKVEFSVIRVPRDRDDEAIFVATLVNSEPDLSTLRDPIAIPIFGRGRSYFSLVGKNITRANLEEYCQFLTGDCSCQVKRANPGRDLLFAVAWQESIKGSAYQTNRLPPLTGVGHLETVAANSTLGADTSAPDQPSTKSDPQESTASVEPADSTHPTKSSEPPAPFGGSLLTWVFGITAVGLIVAAAGTVWFCLGSNA